MQPVEYHGGRVRLYQGDCLATLKGLPSDSVDAVVTDPPYALVSIVKRFGKDGAAPAQGDVYARASAGFMGQAWDTGEVAFAVEFWREVYRVLKPGGHVAAFGGTRTCHALTTAIEGAGFEIRDRLTWIICADTHVAQFLASLSDEQQRAFVRCIEESQFGGELAWIFGSGFPKSHDVAKAITKRVDPRLVREIKLWLAERFEACGKSKAQINREVGFTASDYLKTEAGQDAGGRATWHLLLPYGEKWERLKTVVGFDDRYDAPIAALGSIMAQRSQPKATQDVYGTFSGVVTDYNLTDLATEWQGWGTALKPALEPICLARKPLIGTVAENVLAHGTGAINVDACRVATDEDLGGGRLNGATPVGEGWDRPWMNDPGRREDDATAMAAKVAKAQALGRWPANVLHDGSDEVEAAFDVFGERKAAPRGPNRGRLGYQGGVAYEDAEGVRGYADAGSAARFFYSSKADADDRLGSKHPTVKPVDLMRWLVRLICPPGGTVLDPFAGTGTTGEAAFREGFSSVLCEREPAYLLDIARRMDLVTAGPAIRRAERAKARNKTPKPAPLFGEP